MGYEFDSLDMVVPLIHAALAEDVAGGDVTTACTVPEQDRAEGILTVKEPGVLSGLDVAARTFKEVDSSLIFESDAADGDFVQSGEVAARVIGPTRGILTAERVALNFLQHMSGIATAAAGVAKELTGTGTQVLDTRKTVPGMRLLAKYAVRCGGGQNHRQGLFDMILIKENHVAAAGGIAEAITKARQGAPGLKLEIEVRDLDELGQALINAPDRVMLDNFDPETIVKAVAMVRAADVVPEVEVSGGLTPENVRRYALPGVDFVSMGALTHSPKALDISLVLRRAHRSESESL